MMLYSKYAHLLTHYCLEVKKGDRVMIKSTYLSEPLLIELAKEISKAGGYPFYDIELKNLEASIINNSEISQLAKVNPISKLWSEQFEGYLYIRAPYDIIPEEVDAKKRQVSKDASAPIQKVYAERTGNRSLKRNLCQFPTPYSAQMAGMSLSEYEHFVMNSCRIFEENPMASWKEFGKNQQKVVDYLNNRETIRYVGSNIDLTYSTKGRLWINSDGKTNMPSGEVYTAPVDNSMNGWVHFTLPSIYMGKEVENVRLEIKNGYIESWDASTNKTFLDEIFKIPGTRRFGEAAVGTNYHIDRITKNILFDEKIGGTVHLAIGEAYKQCHGVNESSVHWDMITDMTDGEIYADGELCYQKGHFIVE